MKIIQRDDDIFQLEEHVFSKLKGFPWWPGKIINITYDNKNLKNIIYECHDFNSNTISVIKDKKFIAKFEINCETVFNNTKRKNHLEAIAQAILSYFEEKEEIPKKFQKILEQISTFSGNNKNKKNDEEDNISVVSNNESSIENVPDKKLLGYKREKEKEKKPVEKPKVKEKKDEIKITDIKNNEEKENELKKEESEDENDKIEIKKYKNLSFLEIIKYLKRTSKYINNWNNQNENDKKNNILSYEEKNDFLNLMSYLNKIEVEDTIKFLKMTNIGNYINFINKNVNDSDIKTFTKKFLDVNSDKIAIQSYVEKTIKIPV